MGLIDPLPPVTSVCFAAR